MLATYHILERRTMPVLTEHVWGCDGCGRLVPPLMIAPTVCPRCGGAKHVRMMEYTRRHLSEVWEAKAASLERIDTPERSPGDLLKDLYEG